MRKSTFIGFGLAAALSAPTYVGAADYLIDTDGAHAFIQFRIQHLGYSWLYGRFNEFSGQFSYDEKNPAASKVAVDIRTASIDSNHAERDKHLRGGDFLDVAKFPRARFVSTGFEDKGDGNAVLTGDLTLRRYPSGGDRCPAHRSGRGPLGRLSGGIRGQHPLQACRLQHHPRPGTRLTRG